MADDSRSTISKQPRKIFIVNNPDNNSDDDGDRRRNKPPFVKHDPSMSAPVLRTVNYPHGPSQYPHGPPLSPASTISPVESTPPPSTPGKSGPSESGDTARSAPDRGQGSVGNAPNEAPPRRPQVMQPAQMGPPLRSDKIVILVTADSEQFYPVEITGSTEPAIREKIFSKLHISDEDQHYYSIYRTEIGSFAMGDALSGERLWSLCQELGDAKGFLKFLVSHSSASVHEPSYVNTIPPVLPLPMHTRHQSRTRQGSVSSASDRYNESRLAPYAASVSDLDEAEYGSPRGRDRDTIRPPPRPPVGLPGSLPSQNGFPSPPQSSPLPDPRPASPGSALSPLRPEPGRTRTEKNYGYQQYRPRPPVEEPRDPQRQNSDPNNHNRTPSEPKPYPTNGSRRIEPPQSSPLFQNDADRAMSSRDAFVPIARRGGTTDDWQDHTLSRGFNPSPSRGSPHHSPSVTRPVPPRDKGSSSRRGGPWRVPPAPTIPPPIPPASEPPRPARPSLSGTQGKPVPIGFLKGVSHAKSSGDLRSPPFSFERLPPHPPGLVPGNGTMQKPLLLDDTVGLSSRLMHTARAPQPVGSIGPVSSQTMGPLIRDYARPLQALNETGQANPLLTGSYFRSPPSSESGTIISRSKGNGGSKRSPAEGTSPMASSASGQFGRPRPEPPAIPRSLPFIAPRPHNGTTFTSPPHSPISPHTFRPQPQASYDDATTSSTKVSTRPPDENESTLRPDVRLHMQHILNSQSPSGTLVPMRKQLPIPPQEQRRPSITEVTYPTPPYGYHDDGSSEDEDEDATGTLFKVPFKVPLAPIATGPASSSGTRLPPPSPMQPDHPTNGAQPFDNKNGFTRPLPEQVYDRLDEFFKEHDLDRPVIEATSGSTSPTSTELPPLPVLASAAADGRFRHKKSIRVVADEHKRRIKNRMSTATANDMKHKRSTKLWGSKLEEVTAQMLASGASDSPDSPTAAPTPIFKWVRGELIGKGTYGRVYLALNATTGEMIAVKQVEMPQTASDREDARQVSVVEALKSESETLKDLDHPNIVQYLGFEETPRFLSIFLEYVPGGSVGSCLRKHGKFSDNVTKSFTAQILEGLEYLHSKNILHRDLKADNILVENTGICKISDFGISKRTDAANAEAFTAMSGTVFWMAPEVVKAGKKGYTSKIDIWSVGCVVLEMWAGRRPWEDEETYAVMFKLYNANCGPPVPDDVILTRHAEDFRVRCFAINPEERPTASELRYHPYLELPAFWTFSGNFKDS